MMRLHHACTLSVAFIAVLMADWMANAPFKLGLIPEAQAIVGRPLTPASVAGFARRTTRRTVAVASTEAAASAAATAPAPAPAPAAGTVPIGTVVATLPSGCTQVVSGGVQYQKCGADYYRTAFQGSNLVYVAAQP